MSDRGLLKKHLIGGYRKGEDPLRILVDGIDRTHKSTRDKVTPNRTKIRPFILGYTG
jgi:hypothetical protein